MANQQNTPASSFRSHLETLVRSTSAGALCDTDEEALQALEKRFGIHQASTFSDADVEQYLQSQWQDWEDDSAVNDEEDHADEEAQEPEALQWLRR